MKLKKILSICLVGAMAATMLAACGSSDETVGEEIKEDAETVVDDVKDVAEEAAEDVKDVAEDVGEGVKDAVEDVGEDVKDAAEDAVEDVKDNASGGSSFEGFPETITIEGKGFTLYSTDGVEEVIDAINAISVPAINVELEYSCMDLSSFLEQISLSLAGGEAFDLLQIAPSGNATFSTVQSLNELMDISDYLWEYAPEMTEMMEDYIQCMSVGDAVYGVPNYRVYNSNEYIIMRKDILDYLGLTEQAEAISSWSDYTAIMQAVYDAQDELPDEMQTNAMISNGTADGSVICNTSADFGADDFADDFGFDTLGDNEYRLIYADSDGVVHNYYETDDYKATIERTREWYESDLVYKDTATNTEHGDQLTADGVTFSYVIGSEIGVEEAKKKATGYDVVCVPVVHDMITTTNGVAWGWGVPVTSQEPEAAVAFMNLMWTNADIVNLFVYGIEGRDYELNDEGEAVILDDVVYQASDWMFGNQFLAYPLEGAGGDFREVALEDMLSATVSPFMGCTIDTDPVANELTAVNNVLLKYRPGIESGTTDPSNLDTMLDEMETAGVSIIIDYFQQELDAWLAEQ